MRIAPAAPLGALKTPRDSQIDEKLHKKLNLFNSKTQFPHKVKSALLNTHLLIPKARPKSRAHLCVQSSGRMAKPGRERKMSLRGLESSCGSRGAAYLRWSWDSPPHPWLHAHPLGVRARKAGLLRVQRARQCPARGCGGRAGQGRAGRWDLAVAGRCPPGAPASRSGAQN